jgi:NADH-dependent peroxiredoxin subunit F
VNVVYELLIVGAGPSGLTAAVYAARKKLATLLVSADVGGQTNWTKDVENYMGYQFIEGPELMEKFEAQVRKFPIDMKIGEHVTNVARINGGFEVRSDTGQSYQGKAVIMASGKRPRPLDVPGEDRFRGRGVSYCATCDGPLFEGMNIAVVGGGNSALSATQDLTRIGKHVYLISLTPLTGDAVLIERIKAAPNLTVLTEHETVSLKGDSLLSKITIRDMRTDATKELNVEGVFIEIGLIPNSDPVKDLVSLNELGEIEINCSCETSVAGFFAAGDVTNTPEKQIVVAAGEGAKAALQAHRYLQRLT